MRKADQLIKHVLYYLTLFGTFHSFCVKADTRLGNTDTKREFTHTHTHTLGHTHMHTCSHVLTKKRENHEILTYFLGHSPNG